MDRQEAIDLLRSRGFAVGERDWSLGHSISVGIGGRTERGITVYPVLEYIFPEAGEAWGMTDLARMGVPRTFPSLRDAVEAVTEVMNAALAKLSR
jgi:hypothetical protein